MDGQQNMKKKKIKKKGHLQDLSADDNIIVALKTGWEGTDWVHQTQDRNKLWAFVGKVAEFLGPHYLFSYSINYLLLTDSASLSY